MKKFLAILFLACVPLAPARAIEFEKVSQTELCAAVQEVIKLREAKFQTILGEPSQYTPKTDFTATHVPPGMRRCWVQNFPSVTMYTCTIEHPFPKGEQGNRQALAYLEKAHARYAQCLKPYTTSREPTLNGTAIIYGIPPFPPNESLKSAFVVYTIHNTVYVRFNALND